MQLHVSRFSQCVHFSRQDSAGIFPPLLRLGELSACLMTRHLSVGPRPLCLIETLP